jgi:pimeloyl-ACP methyl ester carboxylesterase
MGAPVITRPPARRRVAVLLAAVLAVPLSAAAAAVPAAAAGPDKTNATEARRVDRVPAPALDWFDCSVFSPGAQCGTANLPLDYDQPAGAKTAVAVLRIKAKDQQHKIGTLFLNPGGPGGSGVEIAAGAPYFLGADVVDKFDIVGFDPRGTNFSDNVKCWKNLGDQNTALSGLNIAFPWTPAETTPYVASSKAFGKACSSTGKPLSGSMSTAEVARDMDVLRRTFGDAKLTYLGFSYGTYLGNVYANLFPDRVRSIVIDGNIDPVGWAGTPANNTVPQTARIRSGEGAAKALHEILVRCGAQGPTYCNFASRGDPLANYAKIITTLKRGPIVIPDFGFELSYATLVSFLLGDMYAPFGSVFVDSDLTLVYDAVLATNPAARAAAAKGLAARVAKAKAGSTAAAAARAKGKDLAFPYEFPYNNSPEAFQSVLCTDGLNPPDAAKWAGYADNADKTAPDFGRIWTWASAPCASKTWTVKDEDAYRGPFTHRTVNPVLVVGNYWDPATNYDSAVTVSRLLPNSRLLSSDSWGHTAYGTSECVNQAVDNYLLTVALPARGTLCVGDSQPFTTPIEPSAGAKAVAPPQRRPLPPVVPPIPGAVPVR